MTVIPPAIGMVLVLVGLTLFLIDLSVTNHGLPTAGAVLALLAGGLALFGAGVPYSGVLLGALVIVAMLMGGVLVGVLGSLSALKGRPALTGKEGMIGEVGTVRSRVGVDSEGWVFVHGERWRAVLAFASEQSKNKRREAAGDRGGAQSGGCGLRRRVGGGGARRLVSSPSAARLDELDRKEYL